MPEVKKHGTRYRVRVWRGGKREWIPLPERIRTQAEADVEGARVAKIIRAGAAQRRLRQPSITAPEGEPLAAWGDRWLADRERRGLATVHTDRGRLKKWVWPVIGALRMKDLERADLERLVRSLDEGVREKLLAWKTAVNVWGLVTKMCRDACASKNQALRVREENPVRDVEGPDRGDPRELAYLFPSEALRLLASPKVPLRWARLYALPLYTALRVGEVAGLEVADVDLDAGVITVARSVNDKGVVGPPKNGRARRVPIHPHILPLVRQLVDEATAARRARLIDAMPPRTGHTGIAVRLRKHLAMAGVRRAELQRDTQTTRRLTYHDLRAACVTWWAIAGVEGLVIQLRAGHSDLKTTSRYVRAAASLVGVEGGVPHPPLPPRLTTAPTTAPSTGVDDAEWLAASGLEVVSPAGVEPSPGGVPAPSGDGNPGESVELATPRDLPGRVGGGAGGGDRARTMIRAALDAALDEGNADMAAALVALLGRGGPPAAPAAGARVVPIDAARRKR